MAVRGTIWSNVLCLWHYTSPAITTIGSRAWPGLIWPCFMYKMQVWSVCMSNAGHVDFYFLTGAPKPLLVSPLLKFTPCLLPRAEGTWKVHKGNKIFQLPLKLNKIIVYGLGLSLPPFPKEKRRKAVDFSKANIRGLEKVKWPQMPDKVFVFFRYNIWILKYDI